MNENETNTTGNAGYECESPAYSGARTSLSAGTDPVGAGLGAIMLLLDLAPSLLRDQSFATIPGGVRLRLGSGEVDLIVSPVDALMANDFAAVEAIVAVTDRSTVVLCDTPFGCIVHAIVMGPSRIEIRAGRLWTDLFDPVFRVVDTCAASKRDWATVRCLELRPGAPPALLAPPDYGAYCIDHGFNEAALRVNRWRTALSGEF